MLLYNGADVNIWNEDGRTALILAAEIGHAEVAKVLIAKGVDVNKGYAYNWTALRAAMHYGYDEISGLLVEAGAKGSPYPCEAWEAGKLLDVNPGISGMNSK